MKFFIQDIFYSLKLSAQPIEKLLNNNQVNDRGLWFRSLLQIMLKEKFKLEGIHLKTGKIAAKCENFNVYVRKAISKLKLDNLLVSFIQILKNEKNMDII